MMRFKLFTVAATLWLSGCSHALHVLHVADFEPGYAALKQGAWVTTETSQFVFLGFVTQTDYVNQAYRQLLEQCPGGAIQGVQTEHSTDHGFFSWTQRLRMQGLCLKKNS